MSNIVLTNVEVLAWSLVNKQHYKQIVFCDEFVNQNF